MIFFVGGCELYVDSDFLLKVFFYLSFAFGCVYTEAFEPPFIVKETVPQESTAQYLSLEWSHLCVSSTDSKVRTTLNSKTNNRKGSWNAHDE